jgi:hypothetical protein
MGHGAWSIEKNRKFAIRNPKLNSWLLTPYVCLVPYALYLVPAA